jgi:hypothetical protein
MMRKRLTISIDETVHDGLVRVVGRGKISRFLEALARPYVLNEELEAAYQAMAADTEREREALSVEQCVDWGRARSPVTLRTIPFADEAAARAASPGRRRGWSLRGRRPRTWPPLQCLPVPPHPEKPSPATSTR